MKYALLIATLIGTTLALSAQQPVFKSGVEAVYLDVTVQAPDGSIVRGLTKKDFVVFDEDTQQEVAIFSDEPAPISVGVLIDTSGSMTGERIAAAIRAAGALGRSLKTNDLWSISTFDSMRRTMIGWRPYEERIINSLRAMPTSGGTELFRSVADMVPYMRDTPHRKRALLVMTDGADNSIISASRYGAGGGPNQLLLDAGVAEAIRKTQDGLRSGEVLLYALGLNVASRAGAIHVPSLQRLAEPTGGTVVVASTLREVEDAATRIADEIRQQYTLGFYPTDTTNPRHHRIRVVTRHPDYRVRTRSGYVPSNGK
ncbi:MAG: VWA domain-containing protein [Acidimicrobiia bacterium]